MRNFSLCLSNQLAVKQALRIILVEDRGTSHFFAPKSCRRPTPRGDSTAWRLRLQKRPMHLGFPAKERKIPVEPRGPLRAPTEEEPVLLGIRDCLEHFREKHGTMTPQQFLRFLEQLRLSTKSFHRHESGPAKWQSELESDEKVLLQRWLMQRMQGIPAPLLLRCLLVLEDLKLCDPLLLRAASKFFLLQMPHLQLREVIQMLQLYVHRRAATHSMCSSLATWLAASLSSTSEAPQSASLGNATSQSEIDNASLVSACECAAKMPGSQRILLQGKSGLGWDEVEARLGLVVGPPP